METYVIDYKKGSRKWGGKFQEKPGRKWAGDGPGEEHTIREGELYTLSQRQHKCLSKAGRGDLGIHVSGTCWNSSSARFPG